MAEDNSAGSDEGGLGGALPNIVILPARTKVDWATVLGLICAVSMIFIAIYLGKSDAQFFNVPSVLIVIVGTIAATAVSFTGSEFVKSGSVISKSIFQRVRDPKNVCDALLGLALISKKKGVLSLSSYETELQKYPFMYRGIQLAIDGYKPEDIEIILEQEIEALIERHRRSSNITQRAAEVAPAMGLIGTLVGLVQMLADLENPETIGPSMAVALLTTFYGAILGTIIMGPLAVKLEKNSADEALLKTLIKTTAVSIARQDNPRRLEMLLNAELPPSQQIKYFD